MKTFEFLGYTYRTNADASIVEAKCGNRWERTFSLSVRSEAQRALSPFVEVPRTINDVEIVRKEKVSAGFYTYTFLVNDESLVFSVYSVQGAGKVAWVYVNEANHDEGGDEHYTSKKAALEALCEYMLCRKRHTSLGYVLCHTVPQEAAQALYTRLRWLRTEG